MRNYIKIQKWMVYIPGVDDMMVKYPTRANTLIALVSLEIAGITPTYREILRYMIEELGVHISNGSVQTVVRHLDNLAKNPVGHIIRKNKKTSKRGGKTAPFRSRYVSTRNTKVRGRESK